MNNNKGINPISQQEFDARVQAEVARIMPQTKYLKDIPVTLNARHFGSVVEFESTGVQPRLGEPTETPESLAVKIVGILDNACFVDGKMASEIASAGSSLIFSDAGYSMYENATLTIAGFIGEIEFDE